MDLEDEIYEYLSTQKEWMKGVDYDDVVDDLMEQFYISRSDAEEYIELFNDSYPDLQLEESDDDWLDDYTEKHPEIFSEILKWVQKKNPDMEPGDQERFAKNILKKKHREGKLDKAKTKEPATEEPKKEEPKSQNQLTEVEEKVDEILNGNFAHYSNGKVKKVEDRNLVPLGVSYKKGDIKRGNCDWVFYRPVSIDGNALTLEKYGFTLRVYKQHEGDWDDGRQHVWTSVYVTFTIDMNDKLGEVVADIKDGKIYVDGKQLSDRNGVVTFSWIENDKFLPYSSRKYAPYSANNYEPHSRRFRSFIDEESQTELDDDSKITLTVGQIKSFLKEELSKNTLKRKHCEDSQAELDKKLQKKLTPREFERLTNFGACFDHDGCASCAHCRMNDYGTFVCTHPLLARNMQTSNEFVCDRFLIWWKSEDPIRASSRIPRPEKK